MIPDELMSWLPYLRRLAQAEGASLQDAEDIVSETILAAMAYLHGGGEIVRPKAWLTQVLLHKRNDMLRRRYRLPSVSLDALGDMAADTEESDISSEESMQVRRELLYLHGAFREILIRYYYRGQSVSRIARETRLPAGTVKSRLSSGRQQLKRRMENMKEEKTVIPMHLNLSYSGDSGPGIDPISLVEGDLIAQNLLILAYDKPLSATELAFRIGIPTVYIEPILRRLTDGELMRETERGLFAADFVIYKPEDSICRLKPQLSFVREHFDRIWRVMEELLDGVRAMPEAQGMRPQIRTKLERYAVMEALQQFEIHHGGRYDRAQFTPRRKNGGTWVAMGWAFPSGYSSPEYDEVCRYTVCGGRRTTGGACDYHGASYLRLREFDTNLWDSPHRFAAAGFGAYFSGIRNLLWCAQTGLAPQDGVPDALLEAIPQLCETGILAREDGALRPDIPVLEREAFARLNALTGTGTARLEEEIGGEYRAFLEGQALSLPAHLRERVPQYQRYRCATQCIVMGIVREAYERGLHLADVDFCCPPVVLEYGMQTL